MNFLKLSIMTLAFSLASVASSQQESPGHKGGSDIGSAFVNGDTLYATVLWDCNALNASLEVEPLCHEDRWTKNFVVTCAAKLNLISTMMACTSNVKVPHIFSISLKESKVAREAQKLNLNINGQIIDIRLK